MLALTGSGAAENAGKGRGEGMLDPQENGAPVGGAIDLAHLARQTLGSAELKREVLELFVAQALFVRDEVHKVELEARRRLAHGLVGSARAVGAFALADCAAALEASPGSAALAESLSTLIDDVRASASELML